MSPRSNLRSPRHRRPSRRGFTGKKFRRFLRWRWREIRAFVYAVWAAHPAVGIPVTVVLVLIVLLGINWTYHAINKPSEVLFALDSTFDKNLAETWQEYGP